MTAGSPEPGDSDKQSTDHDDTGRPALQPTVIRHSSPGSTITESQLSQTDWSLGPAPSMPGESGASHSKLDTLAAGSVLFDFQIHQLLGKGAFGQVYLALQLSLNRFVALKIANDVGSEGSTMAQLEHRNIVQVYSEQIVSETKKRLLCMQFVAGPSLRIALDTLIETSGITWTGKDVMGVISSASTGPTTLQVSDLTGHADVSAMRQTEFTCWLTAQLAYGLAYAHERSVVHRDIKPANILLQSTGTPLLADFNLSEHITGEDRSSAVGGTLAYMAPEQLAAYVAKGSERNVVGPSADIYSLALVLHELMTGRTPIPKAKSAGGSSPRHLAQQLIDYRTAPYNLNPEYSVPTDRILPAVIRRATAPNPDDRTPSAHVLADELTACQRMTTIEHTSGFDGPVSRIARKYPVTAFAVLATVPHVIASVVNVSYNVLRVPDLPASTVLTQASIATSPIMSAFRGTTTWYNVIVWPLCMMFVISMLRKSVRAIRMSPAASRDDEVNQRRTLLELPSRLRAIAMLGWLPGIVVFPMSLILMADASPIPVAAHFVCNLGLSFLIALTYSYLGAIWMIVSVLYAGHWDYPQNFNEHTVRSELSGFSSALSRCHAAAGFVPLMGALLVVVVSPESSSHYLGFRLLLGSLITLGIVGQHIATRTVAVIQNRIELYCD